MEGDQVAPSGSPARLLVRVALTQVVLSLLCWIALGLSNARGAWLLEEAQSVAAVRIFLLELPLLGCLGAVVLPVYWFWKLLAEASEPGLLDTSYVVQVLGFSQRTAFAGLITSVLVFLVAAFHLRWIWAVPPMEAAKIGLLGLVTGTLLAVLSYFSLQPPARQLLRDALDRGAFSPENPSFPIRKKILACCVAVALLVVGLFGMEALSWSQRDAEEKTTAQAVSLVSVLAREAEQSVPQGREAWARFLGGRLHPPGSILFVTGAGGSLLATSPQRVGVVERGLLESDLLTSAGRYPEQGGFVTRWGDARVVARAEVGGHERIGLIAPADPSAGRRVVSSFLLVTLEAGLAATLLAWISGLGMTEPLTRLGQNVAAFASGEDSDERVPVVTDDEVSRLASSFDRMAVTARQAKRQLEEAARRAERDELLACVAHEVRNPLFGISSTLSALEMEIGEGRYAEYFSVLKAESQRLSGLIGQMLAADPTHVTPAGSAELESALGQAERVVQLRFPAREVSVHGSGMEGILLPLDPERARLLFIHLIEGATLRSGSRVEIEVSAQGGDGGSRVMMRDHGELIPEDPFERASIEKAGKAGADWPASYGNASRIIGEAGGEIALTGSTESEGTVFEMHFPAGDPVRHS